MAIKIRAGSAPSTTATTQSISKHSGITQQLKELNLEQFVTIRNAHQDDGTGMIFALTPEYAEQWSPGFDTTGLCQTLNLDSQNDEGLVREILLAMLLAPITFDFPSDAELLSSIRIRKNVVNAARKTSLEFNTTDAAERPEGYWHYHENTGFTLLPGKSLITALELATQPDLSGQHYAFSCYRATEYVILLGIAQELNSCNPGLYEKLQQQWEKSAIMSGKFHDAFLREYGTMEEPLPKKFYVPGDRLWFRNPDEASADVTGYEGSWVFYLGGGLFTNFWDHTRPYTLTSKCVEIFHWRHGLKHHANGNLYIDEDEVARRASATLSDPEETQRILRLMMRYRDPRGVYQEGGCIDTSREYPRCVCPGTADMDLNPAT